MNLKTEDFSIDRLDEYAALFDQYREFYKQSSNIEMAKRFLEERFKKAESKILGATLDTKLVGFTQLYPTFTSVGMQRAWILNDLFVHSDYRKIGVGECLMNAAKDFAKSENSSYIILETAKDNIQAQALYEKLDYKKAESVYFYVLNLK